MRPIVIILAAMTWGGPALAAVPDFETEAVKANCAAEWPGDFAMTAYCLEQRRNGHRAFAASHAGADDELRAAFDACITEWGLQWDMVAYCARQREQGRMEAAAAVADLPGDVAEIILSRCTGQWGLQFEMVSYCARQQVTAWRSLQ